MFEASSFLLFLCLGLDFEIFSFFLTSNEFRVMCGGFAGCGWVIVVVVLVVGQLDDRSVFLDGFGGPGFGPVNLSPFCL